MAETSETICCSLKIICIGLIFHINLNDIKTKFCHQIQQVNLFHSWYSWKKAVEDGTCLKEFMSGDGIVFCSLITFLSVGLFPIISQLSFPPLCPQLAFLLQPKNKIFSFNLGEGNVCRCKGGAYSWCFQVKLKININ